MGYTIVYGKQFIKTNDGRIIPLILAGSNNCYTQNFRGRERRERSWSSIVGGSNNNICFNEVEIYENINSWLGGTYQEHFKMHGIWVDDAKLLKFIQNGIKNAKTIEELSELNRYPIALKVYLSVWYTDGETYKDGTLKTKDKIESKRIVGNSAELNEFLAQADQRLKERQENETIYVCIEFESEKAVPYPKEVKKRKAKEKLTEYYAIKVISNNTYTYTYYLGQLTSRRITGSFNIRYAKQFNTSKEAERWLGKNKIEERFNVKCIIEFAESKASA